MASVQLRLPDFALFSDPTVRVAVPHMIAATAPRDKEQTFVRFEGDRRPTGFRGEGDGRAYQVTCRYGSAEQEEMAALCDLFDLAHEAADCRLVFRSNWFLVPSLGPLEVVQVGGYTPSPIAGGAWDVSFTMTCVEYTLAAV